jgi:hypothetical protein
MLNVVMVSAVIAECRYGECRYAECRYGECRGAYNFIILRCLFLLLTLACFASVRTQGVKGLNFAP